MCIPSSNSQYLRSMSTYLGICTFPLILKRISTVMAGLSAFSNYLVSKALHNQVRMRHLTMRKKVCHVIIQALL